MSERERQVEMMGSAAVAASAETADAIAEAAAENDDPVVGEMLDRAAVSADTTLSRVGWLRGALQRLFGSRT